MLELLSEYKTAGGVQRFYRHASTEIGLPMQFGIFLPAQASGNATTALPALFYLSGLTCNEETFPIKAGAQRAAAAQGMVIITPDTSPRGANIDGETAAWDFGAGAGFYLDATTPKWQSHYRMHSYIVKELVPLICANFPVAADKVGIFGHSMGGHGALVLGLRHPTVFRSVSAFAPIAAPMQCAWGQKAFQGYLGEDQSTWQAYDATQLVASGARSPGPILIDQGEADKFLQQGQLRPDDFAQACAAAGQPLVLNRHAGYDHGYFFIATFVDAHIAHHAALLSAA